MLFQYKHYTFLLAIGVIIVLGLGCDNADHQQPVHETGVVYDIEGNEYATIKIGSQWWMAENLRTTTLRTGEVLTRINIKQAWAETNQPAYTLYNEISDGAGCLYNFHAVRETAQLAPIGWHIPTDEDWKILESHIGMTADEIAGNNWRGTNQGDKLKEESTNTSGWIFHQGVWGNNETGFNASGGSCRVFNGEWGVPGLRHSGFWWSSTEADGYGWFRYLDYQKSGIFRYAAHPNYGFSIRCVKDN